MTSFPTGYGRAPQLLFSSINLSHLARTNNDLFEVSQKLSSGLDLRRPSDDIVRAATVSTLDARIERSEQIVKNLGYAASSLDTLDQALGDAFDLVNEGIGISLAQVQSTASAEERDGQAIIVDSLIDSLYRVASRKSVAGFIFGGTQPGSPPVTDLQGAFRFEGGRGGLTTDLGVGLNIPVTIGANNAIGAVSNRIEGAVDLDAALQLDTRIQDLNGARDLGVSLGVVNAAFNGGTTFSIDLSGARTVGDVVDSLTAAIQDYEFTSGDTVLDTGGVSISGGALSIDVVAGGSLQFADLEGGSTGADLGVVFDPAAPFDELTTTAGAELDAKLTWTTEIASLRGLAGPLGQVRLNNNGQAFTVDLSGATTLADLRSAFEQGGTQVSVEINGTGTGINIVTRLSGTDERSLSIAEIDDGAGRTAEALGVRSFSRDTLLSDFNDGRGVSVVSGRVDQDGALDPALNTDFTITLGDGFEIDIDLSPSDLTDVGAIIDAINTQADAQLTAAARPTTDFAASLTDDDNGIFFTQTAVPDPISVERKNNSPAADDLGLLDGTTLTGGLEFRGEDRAKVRVDNLFTALMDLAKALRTDDTVGIQFASGRMQEMVDRLTEQRALVGGFARQVDNETLREEDRTVLDTTTRSQLRDTNFAEASTQFSLLQTQLQASLLVTSQANSLSLLDFIG
ncbi:MAG: hypothetical protein DHS20C14_01050 [Phycisphaeraceae bacterium]|nr:MAG: hypothetical protein DHS20C14_01050 [Phycisphaeraceae bacterium]